MSIIVTIASLYVYVLSVHDSVPSLASTYTRIHYETVASFLSDTISGRLCDCLLHIPKESNKQQSLW